jgi:hypothetical protein
LLTGSVFTTCGGGKQADALDAGFLRRDWGCGLLDREKRSWSQKQQEQRDPDA